METKTEDNMAELQTIIGIEETSKLIKLCSNYDNYIKRYKKSVNEILAPFGYQVLLAHSFVDEDTKDKIFQGELNGDTNEISTDT